MTTNSAGVDLGGIYRETRERLSELVLALDTSELATPVPACPGWSVSDVVNHALGVVEDVTAGRLTGPSTDEQTAEQLARHRGTPIAAVVDAWAEVAPPFEARIRRATAWPPVLDLATHEQDIRGALSRPGARDSAAVILGAECLLALLQPAVPMRVVCEDFDARVGPDGGEQTRLVLRTTRFETFRWRMGRRSRSQVAALDWSGDPTPVLDDLFVFGPSPTDIVE